MNSWERNVRNVIDDDLFVAFYAGMDAYVDMIREDVPDGSSDWGYVGPETAARLFKTWRAIAELSCYGDL